MAPDFMQGFRLCFLLYFASVFLLREDKRGQQRALALLSFAGLCRRSRVDTRCRHADILIAHFGRLVDRLGAIFRRLLLIYNI